MLLGLRMYYCTANSRSCQDFHEELSRVDGEYLVRRKIVLAQMLLQRVSSFVNYFVSGEEATLKEMSRRRDGSSRVG
jgi:Peptidase family M49